MKIEFENENKVALEDFNGDYFNSTGAEFYRAGDYDTSFLMETFLPKYQEKE